MVDPPLDLILVYTCNGIRVFDRVRLQAPFTAGLCSKHALCPEHGCANLRPGTHTLPSKTFGELTSLRVDF